jgi:hypothetical protein
MVCPVDLMWFYGLLSRKKRQGTLLLLDRFVLIVSEFHDHFTNRNTGSATCTDSKQLESDLQKKNTGPASVNPAGVRSVKVTGVRSGGLPLAVRSVPLQWYIQTPSNNADQFRIYFHA